MMKLFIVILSTLVVAHGAKVDVGAAPADYLKIVRGSRSVARDDATASSLCPEDYELLKCECESFASDPDGCDGATIINDVQGVKCIARNGATGKGVVAKATCGQVMITVHTEYKSNPKLRCPQRYRLISCSMLSPFFHQYYERDRPPPPRVLLDGGLCKVTKGCDHCKISARCIRQAAFFGPKKG